MLNSLPAQSSPDLIIGLNQIDDSGVVRIGEDKAIILSLDFFPAVVDDPYTFGAIAAANALSDVYAMGGNPIAAMNIVCFPDDALELDVLTDVLKGGAEKVNEAGAVIVGGHTISDKELKYGLSVTGVIDPANLVRINGAKPGDALVLTKPLGSGIYSTALKRGALSSEEEKLLYDVMSSLNNIASREMISHGVNACTDVTGFGLLGHLLEMMEESKTSAVIDCNALPLMPKLVDFAERGFLTGGGMANYRFATQDVKVEGELTPEFSMVLYDPQTSGGLLVSLPADRSEKYVATLHRLGVDGARIIGEVVEKRKEKILVKAPA